MCVAKIVVETEAFFVSPRGTALSHKKKYGAKQVRYADGGGMSAKREEVEMRTKTKMRVETAPPMLLTDDEPT